MNIFCFFLHSSPGLDYFCFCFIPNTNKWLFLTFIVVQSLSHVRLFVTPWTAADQASLSFTISQSLSHESLMPSNHLSLCRPLLLLLSIFPRIKVFSKESILRIRWPKYWNFSFSVSPSNEYSGLTSFCRGSSQPRNQTWHLLHLLHWQVGPLPFDPHILAQFLNKDYIFLSFSFLDFILNGYTVAVWAIYFRRIYKNINNFLVVTKYV